MYFIFTEGFGRFQSDAEAPGRGYRYATPGTGTQHPDLPRFWLGWFLFERGIAVISLRDILRATKVLPPAINRML